MSDEQVSSLLAAATKLAADLGRASGDEQAPRIRERLVTSVVRPLRQAAGSEPGGTAHAAPSAEDPLASLADALWELAQAATALRVGHTW